MVEAGDAAPVGIDEHAPPPEPARRSHQQEEWLEPPHAGPDIDPPPPEDPAAAPAPTHLTPQQRLEQLKQKRTSP